MAALVVFLPLLAAAIAGFFGRVIGDRGAQIVTCGALVLSAIFGIFVFRDIMGQSQPHIEALATWISAGGVDVEWSLRLDTLSGVMILVVTIVSAMVHIYSVGYMAHDHSIPRFMAFYSGSGPNWAPSYRQSRGRFTTDNCGQFSACSWPLPALDLAPRCPPVGGRNERNKPG